MIVMRRLLMVGWLAVLGCEAAPPPEIVFDAAATASAGASYPARSDWLVVQPPAAVPPAWNTTGYPPIRSLELGAGKSPDENQIKILKSEVGKNILNPFDDNLLPKSDREAVSKAIAAQFGTPFAPMVPTGKSAEAVDNLKLQPEKLAHGAGIYRQWCVSCHGPTGGGDGPAALTLSPPPRDYRSGLFKFVTSSPTHAAGKPRRADLARTIRRGLDGSAMPAFPRLTEDELDSVISYVIHLSVRGEAEFAAIKRLIIAWEDADPPAKEASNAADKSLAQWLSAETQPMMLPKPDATSEEQAVGVVIPPDPAKTEDDRLTAAGRGYLLFVEKTGAGCASCHVDYGRTPQLKYDAWGNIIQPRNLLLGMYRAGRTPEDLYARIYVGIAGSGMPSHRQLVEPAAEDGLDKIWDLVHFLQAAADPAKREELRARYGVKW